MSTGFAEDQAVVVEVQFVVDRFELTLHDHDVESGAELAARVRDLLSNQLEQTLLELTELFDIHVDEVEVWEGSRKSGNRVRLVLRKPPQGPGFWIWLKRLSIVLGLLSTDPDQIQENLESAYGWVAGQMESEGERIDIVRTPPDRPPRQSRGEKSGDGDHQQG